VTLKVSKEKPAMSFRLVRSLNSLNVQQRVQLVLQEKKELLDHLGLKVTEVSVDRQVSMDLPESLVVKGCQGYQEILVDLDLKGLQAFEVLQEMMV